MSKRIALPLGIMLALGFALSAPAQSTPQTDDIYIENIEVNVVSVDVFVTDKDGKPVVGLTKDDFEIVEAGAAQEITNFSEVRDDVSRPAVPTQSPAPAEKIPEGRSRKIILFIDNDTLHPFNRNKVFNQMRRFLGLLVRPGDQAMLSVWQDGLHIEVGFTSLLSEFERALDRLQAENTGNSQRIIRRKQAESRIRSDLAMAQDRRSGLTINDAYRQSISTANEYSEQVRTEIRAKAVAMNGLLATFAGVDGKKAMIFVGEELPTHPGLDLYQFVNETYRPYAGSGRETLILQTPESLATPENLVLDSIGRAANANGVTIYMLNASGGTNLGDTPVESSEPGSPDIEFIQTMSRINSFQKLASKTGGLSFVQSSNIEGAFDRIETDFGTYYSLGYRAGSPQLRGERQLVIHAKRQGLVVRTRTSYFAKNSADQMTDRVVANLFYDIGPGDLPIRVVARKPEKAQRGAFKLPIDILIPFDSMTLLPVNEKLSGKFTVFVGVGDGKGGVSNIDRKTRTVQVPLQDGPGLSGKFFTYSMELLVAKGENIIAVAVQDDLSKMSGFKRTRVEAK